MSDLIIVGTEFPTESHGQGFFQVDQGQLWAYLNSQWSPITGNKKYTITAPVSIFIAGVLRNSQIDLTTISIANNLTSKPDTCSFLMFDDGDYDIRPVVGQQIDIYSYDTNTKIFSGEISNYMQKERNLGTLRFEYKISSTDFTRRFSKRLVNKDYTSEKAGDIIKDIIDTYFTEFSYINVEDGPTIDYVKFSYINGDSAIKKIAKLTGYDWYVDFNKDLHFFLPSTNYAPYELTEVLATSGNYTGLNFKSDKTNYKNKVYLQGSSFLEAFNDDIQVADGSQTTFNLAYEPHTPIVVSVDTGGGYVAKTLGIDNIDTSGYDFVVNYSEKCVRNLDLATLNSGDKIKVTYKKAVKLIVYDEDTTSQSDIQAREGGDGIYEYKINDNTIEDIDTARDRITAEITDFKDPLVNGSYKSNQYGYEAGQILKINLPSWGQASKEYKIQTVIIRPTTQLGNDNRFHIGYTIKFQSFDRGFDNWLLDIYNNSVGKEIVIKGDEKVTT